MFKYSSRPQTPKFQYIFLHSYAYNWDENVIHRLENNLIHVKIFQYIFLQWVCPFMYTRLLSLGGVRGQYSL